MTDDLPAGGVPLPENPTWDPCLPGEVAQRLAQVEVPWYVAGGWALDLHRGHVSRGHADLEIAVPAAGFPVIRDAFRDLEFLAVGDGQAWPLDSPAYEVTHQTWGRDRKSGIWRLDVFREPHEADLWICRRDPRIRRPYHEIIHWTTDGVPYLSPEIVLLFKAKHNRPKDDADFTASLPLLTPQQCGWLVSALRAVHPDHVWLESVANGGDDDHPD